MKDIKNIDLFFQSFAAKGSNNKGHALFYLANRYKTNQNLKSQDIYLIVLYSCSSATKGRTNKACHVFAIKQKQYDSEENRQYFCAVLLFFCCERVEH